MQRRSFRHLLTRVLVAGIAVTGAACSLVAGLDKLQFSDDCQSPCDDGNPCTANDCLVSGVCQGQPSAEGTTCATDAGLPGACVGTQCAESCSARNCDNLNPCMGGACIAATQTCVYVNLTDGTQTPGVLDPAADCHAYLCKGGTSVYSVDDSDDQDPATPCLRYACDGGVRSPPEVLVGTKCGSSADQICTDAGACGCTTSAECQAPMICGGGGTTGSCGCVAPTTCAGAGLTCGTYDDACTTDLSCDGTPPIKDGTETDVNCGGPLPGDGGTCAQRCGLAKSCKLDRDCQSNACVNGACCSSACTALCYGCNGSGACVALAKGAHGKCPGSEVCDATQVCKKPPGASCNASSQCLNFCKSGVCH